MDSTDKPFLIGIVGPTASGKTDCAVALCQRLHGEVISCDSMQVYRGLDIGTAKPTPEERKGIPHHMIDIVDPSESFTVSAFSQRASDIISELTVKSVPPVLCGGTGLYVDALIKPMGFSEQGDEVLRASLKRVAQEEGAQRLHDMLKDIDPDSAQRLHPNDTRRVIRAIEIYRLTGVTLTESMRADRAREGHYRTALYALNWPRDELYDRINRRVDRMIDEGLIAEVEALLSTGLSESATCMQGLGYKETVAYLQGRCTKDDMIEAIKQGTRRFAKRQMTWFKRNDEIRWLDASGRSAESLADEIMEAATGYEHSQ